MSATHAGVTGRGSADEPAAITVTGPIGAVVTLTARGHLDEDAADRLTAAAESALLRVAGGAERVVVDLAEVTQLAMEALQPLVVLARACREAGVPLRVRPSPVARRKIVLTGLAESLPVEE